MNSMLPSAESQAVCDSEDWNETWPSIESNISEVTSSCCWSWEFVSISFPEYKKTSENPLPTVQKTPSKHVIFMVSAVYMFLEAN